MVVLFADPGTFMEGTKNINFFLKSYFYLGEASESVVMKELNSPASFPNTMTTISEVDRVQVTEVFRRILSKSIFGWVGLLAFIVLAALRWRVLLPLAPMLALGLLSFQSSNRFIMYLAPFIGIGLGWLLQIGIDGVFYFLQQMH